MSQRIFVATLFLLAASWIGRGPAGAQTPPVICACAEERDFGSCLVGAPVNYPGNFPGSAAVAAFTDDEGNEVVHVFVADLYDGFTYRYDGTLNGGTLKADTPFQLFVSPGGSRETTGLTYNPIDRHLYWAIEGWIYRTDLDLRNVTQFSRVDMARLKTGLNLPVLGTLGGIAFHPVRESLWGVDISNDIYFEFNPETGTIIEDGGVPIHFRNPSLSPYGGGAYGNGITYVNSENQSYFDIPVGQLIEGGAIRVVRVFAAAGSMGGVPYSIGDPAGISYEITPGAGSFDFISGIASWPLTCGAGHTEILLDIRPIGTPSRILQFSVDDPKSSAVVDFEATPTNNTVKLSWGILSPYKTLEIKRIGLPAGTSTVVASLTDPANDPREITERNIPDGTYEYTAQVTPNAPGRKLPPAQTVITVGQGSVVAYGRYAISERSADGEPFAIDYVASSGEVLVADAKTGFAHRYGSDLSPKGFFAGPFVNDAKTGGRTVGIAWNSDAGNLAWVLQHQNGNFLQITDLAGALIGTRKQIQVPTNLLKVPAIGDISFDPIRKEFWGVDSINMVAFTFDAAGVLTGNSRTIQLQVPRSPGGILPGGIAVVGADSTPGNLVLDLVAAKVATGSTQDLARTSLTRSGADLTLPGTETATILLSETLQSIEVGGLTAVVEVGTRYEYIVGTDTGTIYKVLMDSGLQGKPFIRGDVNSDGGFNLSDPIGILIALFRSGTTIACEDAANVNDDGEVNISDAVHLFAYLFSNGAAPLAPFPECGRDFDEPLGCAQSTCK